ncbi:hypothetical protein [Streptomyces sp. NBC_01233]|uniref:hypothetical protein n=1 Tax=Streptomyces sp. NBC_01233 TaxID=2903787 RepID=UPI002E167643|nr:hypothetical protein OG332_17905 [Streptomyces sp. NBC_01233]
MSTQTSHTSSPAPAVQGSHHWVLTLELPGRAVSTQYGTYTPPVGWTRHDVFMAIKREIGEQRPELATANVMFFALEPNQL